MSAAARSSPGLRLLPPAGRSTLVLSGSGGRFRGELLVANDGTTPLEVQVTALEGKLPAPAARDAAPAVLDPARALVPAGGTTRAAFAGSLDPLTPPGSYEASVTVNGVRHPAVLEVVERVELSLSEKELVVFAVPGKQHRRAVATNRGNVPLAISRLGPVPLVYDTPRRSLLSRMGVVDERRAVRPPPPVADEERPTVEAWLEEPVELAPGAVAVLDWTIEVKGTLPPGIRHRATAALYTSDVTFVVTPPQEWPERRRAADRPTRAPQGSRAKAAAPRERQKRRNA